MVDNLMVFQLVGILFIIKKLYKVIHVEWDNNKLRIENG